MLAFGPVFSSCSAGQNIEPEIFATNGTNTMDTFSNQMKIKVGSAIFTATLLNNETVAAFKELFPITVEMTELN
jgi:hypothetical protein